MSESFCLVREGWIPCETKDGLVVDVGLSEALRRAHEFRALSDASPLVTVALTRLCLAILHRSFGPTNVDSWIEIFDAGRFDEARLEDYLGGWIERFDLFHSERPFYQVRGLPFEPDPISILVTERTSWGGGVHLFEHRPQGVGAALSPAEAARWLVTMQAFAPGGLVRKPGEPTSATAAPLNRGAVVTVRGETLFETLLFNLLIYAPDQNLPIPGRSGEDAPAWERDAPPKQLAKSSEPRRVPHGWLDLLTWQSRRLELVSREGKVIGCTRCVGEGLDEGTPHDPMIAWRLDPKKGAIPVGFDVERAFWRDSHALFRAKDRDSNVERPRSIEQVTSSELRRLLGSRRRFALDLMGMKGDQAKILLVRSERVPVSTHLLADPDLGESVREVLSVLETTVEALRTGLFVLASHALAPGERVADKAQARELVRSLGVEASFWTGMKLRFDTFLQMLADDDSLARSTFERACREEALRTYDAASDALGASARVLKGAALGRVSLFRKLPEILPTVQGVIEP